MAPSRRWLLLTFLALAVWFSLFGFAWSTIGGPYNSVIGRASAFAWRVLSISDATYVQATAEEIELKVIRPLPDGRTLEIPYYFSGYFQVSLGLVVALFIATPKVRFGRKALWCLVTAVVLCAFHVVFLVSILHVEIARQVLPHLGVPSGGDVEWINRLLAIAKHLVPVTLWGGALLLMWRRRSHQGASTRKPQAT